MMIETHPELPTEVTKLYTLSLKHHKFVREEIESLLKAGPIKRPMSSYTRPVIINPSKCKSGALLAEMKD